MKYLLLLAFSLISCPIILISQTNENDFIKLAYGTIWKRGEFQGVLTLSNEDKIDLKSLNDSLKVSLIKEFQFNADASKDLFLQLPVRNNSSNPDAAFYTISAYFDHDPMFPDQVLDYNCGDLSYDLSDGYNHAGTDFFSWPFPWEKMYNDEIQVIAAAPGILIFKQDGFFDQNCDLNNSDWNGCGILHDDGSTTWYIHMKKNSITPKDVGQPVASGEYLGVVGSSGTSVSPHLHFEILNSDNKYIDPFEGSCNVTINHSMWLDQLPYKEKAIVKLTTNSKLPVLDDCPEPEITYESDQFVPNDTIIFMIYLKNISENDLLELSLHRPDHTTYATWSWTSPWPFYAASWLYFYAVLKNDDFGEWNFEVKYNDINYHQAFQYKETQNIYENTDPVIKIGPNPASSELTISSNLIIKEIQILDYSGIEKLKLSEKTHPNSMVFINTSSMENGLYFIKIYTENLVFTRKVLIRKESR